jgi:hypothetical protein
MAHILGRDAKAYWDATDQTLFTDSVDQSEVTTWLGTATVVSNIMDLSLELGSEFVDSTTRAEAGQGFASEIPVLANGRVTFDIRWEPGNAFFTEVINCWQGASSATGSDHEISMAILDYTYDDSGRTVMGLASNFAVSISKTENLRDIQKASVTLAISSNPFWSDVTNP